MFQREKSDKGKTVRIPCCSCPSWLGTIASIRVASFAGPTTRPTCTALRWITVVLHGCPIRTFVSRSGVLYRRCWLVTQTRGVCGVSNRHRLYTRCELRVAYQMVERCRLYTYFMPRSRGTPERLALPPPSLFFHINPCAQHKSCPYLESNAF